MDFDLDDLLDEIKEPVKKEKKKLEKTYFEFLPPKTNLPGKIVEYLYSRWCERLHMYAQRATPL